MPLKSVTSELLTLMAHPPKKQIKNFETHLTEL